MNRSLHENHQMYKKTCSHKNEEYFCSQTLAKRYNNLYILEPLNQSLPVKQVEVKQVEAFSRDHTHACLKHLVTDKKTLWDIQEFVLVSELYDYGIFPFYFFICISLD